MKKILIAIDYAPSAQKVAEVGYQLGKAMNAEIILLHVVADSMYYTSAQYSPIMGFAGFNTPDLLSISVAEELHKTALGFLQATKTHLGDEAIQTITEEGNTAEAILRVAKERDVAIIVMGSHGRSGLNKILMGSVAEGVLHHSELPLLLVPAKE